MSNIFEIPLSIGQPQNVSITLAGVLYRLIFKYLNQSEGGWLMDIYSATNVPILQGVPVITGCNLLNQYGYLNFGGRLWVQTITYPDIPPTFDNFGGDGKVFWVTS